MYWYDDITSELIHEQLAERRAAAALERLAYAHRPVRGPWRLAIGRTLIRLGGWIMGSDAAKRRQSHALP